MSYSRNRNKPPTPVRRKPSSSYRPSRQYGSKQGARKPVWLIIGTLVVVALVGAFVVFRTSRPSANNPAVQNALSPLVQEATKETDTSAGLASTPAVTGTVVTVSTTSVLSVEQQQQRLFELLNTRRQMDGSSRLDWDATAAISAQAHAQEMADLGYSSHWNIDGYGPAFRYSRVGGLNAVDEAPYVYKGDLLNNTEITEAILQDVYQQLSQDDAFMQQLLDPEYTHLGIGIAVNRTNGLRLVAAYSRHYIVLSAIPVKLQLGTRIALRGNLLPGTSNPRGELAYEPVPDPLSLAALNATEVYTSPVVLLGDIPLTVDQTGNFQGEVVFTGSPGLYHIRVAVDTANQTGIKAADVVVEVR